MISQSEQYPAQNVSPETGTHFNSGDQIDLHASQLDPAEKARQDAAVAVASLEAFKVKRAEQIATPDQTMARAIGRVGSSTYAMRSAAVEEVA